MSGLKILNAEVVKLVYLPTGRQARSLEEVLLSGLKILNAEVVKLVYTQS